MNKPKFPRICIASAFLIILLACAQPEYLTFNNPVMSTELMQAELDRLHQINLTVASGDFDHSVYPIAVGVDSRNGKMLVEKFICWDECPDVGMVFLMYQSVPSEEACVDALVGTPLFSPEPTPGQYWGCRPIVDWLNQPGTTPG